MRFSQDFIEKVREANNLVSLVEDYSQLKRQGSRAMGLCPFPNHRERTPSFSVSEDRQLYHCFGCKKSGNLFTFVTEMKGLSFPEAVEYLAGRAGIEVPTESRSPENSSRPQKDKKTFHEINGLALGFFHAQLGRLPKDHSVKNYCRSRGINEEVYRIFKLGYAGESWDALSNFLLGRGVSLEAASELGLIRPRPKDPESYYDLFRHRLMFPILLPGDQCVGFGGRRLDEEQNPKYINSPESLLFSKGRVLYGLNETGKYIREMDEAVLVEGYMDLIALYQAGVKNVVATLGTAFTRDHAQLLKRYTRNVLVLFDGDEAGVSAAERSLPILLSSGLFPKWMPLPQDQDPDDYIRARGLEQFNLEKSRSGELFSELLKRALVGYRGEPVQKIQIADRFMPILENVPEERLYRLYMGELAERLGVDLDWLNSSRRRLKNHARGPETPLESVTVTSGPAVLALEGKIKVLKPPKSELILLNLALHRESVMKQLMEANEVENFNHPGLREILRMAMEEYGQMPSKFATLSSFLMSKVEPSRVVCEYLDAPWSQLDEAGINKLVADCRKQIKRKNLKLEANQLSENLKAQSPEEQIRHLERIMNIQKGLHSTKDEDLRG